MLRLYTLGGLRIELDGKLLRLPTPKARDLLAYLILHHDRPFPRDLLAGAFWHDRPEEKARRRFSDTLWRVRRVLSDHVMADDERIWFNTELPCWLDVEQFQSTAPTGVSDSSVAWGDYDDDLDILLAGHNGSDYVTKVWRNECFQVYLPLVLKDY